MYALVVDNQLEQVGLPRSGQLSDGRRVSNYSALPVEILEEEGWVEVQDLGPPAYDPETENLIKSYEVTVDGAVNLVYSVETRPELPSEPFQEFHKRLVEVEAKVGSVPDWVQPEGAHDAYPAEAKVNNNGKTWNNTHGDGNVWEPGVYGWEEVV